MSLEPTPPIAPDDFRLFVDSVDDYALYMLDPSGRIVTWNRGAERLKGWRASEIVGRSLSTFYLPDERAAGLPAQELQWATQSGCYHGESWRLRKDGSRFWADVTITALRGPDGALRGFAHITRDLTERKQQSERLLAARVERVRREAHEEGLRTPGVLAPVRNRVARVLVALLLPSALLLLHVLITPDSHRTPFLVADAGVFVVTWLAGRGPGWLAVAVAALLEDWFLLPPHGGLALDPSSLLALGVFVACSAIIITLVDRSRRSAASALQWRGRERSRLLALQAAGIGTFELDPATRTIDLDSRCRALFGLSPGAEVTHDGLVAAIHPEDRSRVQRLRDWALDSASGGIYEAEYRVIGIEDRVLRWLSVAGRVTFDAAGRPQRLLGAVSDVGRRREAEQEAEQSRRSQRALFDQSPVGVFTADESGRFVEINRAGCRMLGVDCGQLIGRSVADLLPEEDLPRLAAVRESIGRGGVDISEWHLRCASGELLPVEVTTWMLPDGKWSAFCRDISERRRTEEAARSEAQYRERVVAIVGHDLKSPLSAVLMSARTLLRGSLGEREAQAAERIVRSGERMQHLITDVLDYSQSRAGGLAVSPRSADVGELCRAVLDEVRAGRPDRELRLETAGALIAEFDGGRLAQALGNLVANAIRYGAPGTPITVRAEEHGAEVWLSVHNLGDPIPAAQLPHLFEAFRRGEHERKPGSVGLGLYITDRVVRAHGGRIDVESTRDGGTRFVIRLPKSPPHQEEPATHRVLH